MNRFFNHNAHLEYLGQVKKNKSSGRDVYILFTAAYTETNELTSPSIHSLLIMLCNLAKNQLKMMT